MTSELCKHGQVVCEDCAFERGQLWAVRKVEEWRDETYGAEKYLLRQVADELRQGVEGDEND